MHRKKLLHVLFPLALACISNPSWAGAFLTVAVGQHFIQGATEPASLYGGRIGVGYQWLIPNTHAWHITGELGLSQWGDFATNTHRMPPANVRDRFHISPTLEALLGVNYQHGHYLVFLKGGAAHESMQYTGGLLGISGLTKTTPVIDVGAGYQFNPYVALTLDYWRNVAGTPTLKLTDMSGAITDVPTLSAFRAGVRITL